MHISFVIFQTKNGGGFTSLHRPEATILEQASGFRHHTTRAQRTLR